MQGFLCRLGHRVRPPYARPSLHAPLRLSRGAAVALLRRRANVAGRGRGREEGGLMAELGFGFGVGVWGDRLSAQHAWALI